VPTGIATLDEALSDGGVPCGRLTEIFGARGSGRTTLARQIVASALDTGRWVAYVDGSRTLAPRDWAVLGGTRRLWIIRPPNAERSAWCADVLLRSGAFGLVVLDGGPPLTRQVAVRLTHLARDHDAALLLVGEAQAGGVIGAVRLTVRRQRADRPALSAWPSRRAQAGVPQNSLGAGSERTVRTLRITIEKGGTHHSAEVSCAIDVARRLCAHPEVPDRRGVAARNRQGKRVPAGPAGSPAVPPPGGAVAADTGSVLPRKRRFAEPVVRRDAFLLAGGSGR
jgi:hypothetical protein